MFLTTRTLTRDARSGELRSSNPITADLADATGFDAPLLVTVHVPRSAAYKSLVRFDSSRQLFSRFVVHSQANPMQHEPSGLLSDTNRAVQLIRTDSVFSVGNQPKGAQPLV